MKVISYIFSVGLLLFLSCGNKYDDYSELQFKIFQPVDTTLQILVSDIVKADTLLSLLCTGKDVEWYNATTHELKFKDYVETNITNFFVFYNDEFLFELGWVSPVMSYVLNYPVLIGFGNERIFNIGKGYPDWDLECFAKDDPLRIEREKNWETIEPGWNLFVKQLKKEGRYRK
jgi:hypothetical protein